MSKSQNMSVISIDNLELLFSRSGFIRCHSQKQGDKYPNYPKYLCCSPFLSALASPGPSLFAVVICSAYFQLSFPGCWDDISFLTSVGLNMGWPPGFSWPFWLEVSVLHLWSVLWVHQSSWVGPTCPLPSGLCWVADRGPLQIPLLGFLDQPNFA